jgi:hypothetical protein
MAEENAVAIAGSMISASEVFRKLVILGYVVNRSVYRIADQNKYNNL